MTWLWPLPLLRRVFPHTPKQKADRLCRASERHAELSRYHGEQERAHRRARVAHLNKSQELFNEAEALDPISDEERGGEGTPSRQRPP